MGIIKKESFKGELMKKLKNITILLICLFFASLNFNLILKPLNLVTGGTQGLAILINHLINIKPSTIVLIINIITIIASYLFLTKENTYSALIATFAYPLFIRITSYIPLFNLSENLIFIWSILAGIICGITGGIIYLLEFSSGGISTVNLLINKFFHIKLSLSNFIVNSIIIILGYFHFGFIKAICSITVIIISSIIINIILKKKRN